MTIHSRPGGLARPGVVGCFAVVVLLGCGSAAEPGAPPVKLSPVPGTTLKQVTLTKDAVHRLAIATQPVASRSVSVAGVVATHTVIPYSAVVYDTDGSTWTYVENEDGVYVRAAVTVDEIQNQTAVLGSGPQAGTRVVVVGAPELLGAEYEISGEQ